MYLEFLFLTQIEFPERPPAGLETSSLEKLMQLTGEC
jgi:hypothetical protein